MRLLISSFSDIIDETENETESEDTSEEATPPPVTPKKRYFFKYWQ
jgi:hypothetical protein